MYHLLAGSLVLLIFVLGTATSIVTTKALQDWAASALDVRTSTGEQIGMTPRPSAYVQR